MYILYGRQLFCLALCLTCISRVGGDRYEVVWEWLVKFYAECAGPILWVQVGSFLIVGNWGEESRCLVDSVTEWRW